MTKQKKPSISKNLFTVIVATLFTAFVANAQDEVVELKPFKVDVSLGFGLPEGSGAKGGGIFSIEPKYAVINNLSVGLRLEIAAFARAKQSNGDGTVSDAEVKASGSYLLTGDYYFTDNYSFRPFAGLGAGIYSVASATTASAEVVNGGTKFGGMVRAGFEAHHFRLGIEYNLVPTSNGVGLDSNQQPVPVQISNRYFGFKIGVVFGGGRKSKN